MKEVDNVPDAIDLLGGNMTVAKMFPKITNKTVSGWRIDNRFPATTYVVLHSRLRELQIDAPARLWGMRGRA